jgi:GT2 family glycosyltransferase
MVFPKDKIGRHFCMNMPLNTPETLSNREFQSVTHACCLMRRSDFEKIKYDESFVFGDAEDTEFNFRMRFELGKKCVVGYKCTGIHLEFGTRNQFMTERLEASEHNYHSIFLPRWGDKIIIDGDTK